MIKVWKRMKNNIIIPWQYCLHGGSKSQVIIISLPVYEIKCKKGDIQMHQQLKKQILKIFKIYTIQSQENKKLQINLLQTQNLPEENLKPLERW